ncbi:hypothetical protein [Nitrobacter sp.]|uniref:hypothetical protein n=1 Tax=Nitrobacter sp. TaxID=29420 RepID=UPI0029CAC355|nr:hypothetical protein [Nitrobacter sp.]
MRPGNVGSAVVSDKISDLNRTGSQLLLVSFIKAFERDGGEVGRRQKKLKRRTRCPSFMISMTSLGGSYLVYCYRRDARVFVIIYNQLDSRHFTSPIVPHTTP